MKHSLILVFALIAFVSAHYETGCHRGNCRQGPPGRNGLQGPPGPSGPPGPPGPDFVYARDRFVDPINGNDVTNNGGVASPYSTLGRALLDTIGASSTDPWNIHLFPGPIPGPVVWKPFVSLFGTGYSSSIITGDFTYISPPNLLPNPVHTFQISNIGFRGEVTIDYGTNDANSAHFTSCFITSLNYTSLPVYLDSATDLFLDQSFLINAIVNGPLELTGTVVFGDITLLNGPSPPFIQAAGGSFQGTVVLHGNSELYTFGTEFGAEVTAIPESGSTPIWMTASESLGLATLTPGSLVRIVDVDTKVAGYTYPQFAPGTVTGPGSVTGNFTVTVESFVPVDTSSEAAIITLPPAADYIGRFVAIAKISNNLTPVTVQTADGSLIRNSATLVFFLPFETRLLMSNGITYSIIGFSI